MFYDKRGLQITARSQESVDIFDEAVEEYLGNGRDSVVILRRLGELDPDMILGQCLRGYFMQLPSRQHLMKEAKRCWEKAQKLAVHGNERERQHVKALSAWCSGNISLSANIFDEILLKYPHDILAFRLAHHLYFFIGALPAMLASSSRAIQRWDESIPGFGYILGCWAFALEENGDPVSADAIGRRAIEINSADIWAGHAVAHCLETLGKRVEGIAWITSHSEIWIKRGSFANHLWWHRSLHYLELERFDDVLNAFDKEYWPRPSEDNTDIGNATSILMRLEILGVDVGNRWDRVAEVCANRIGDCFRPFNDLHFLMGLAMSGRLKLAEDMIAAMQKFAEENAQKGVTTAQVGCDVGIAVGKAIIAYARREYCVVVRTMLNLRYKMVPLGGSWAQRDCWIRMLIDAARRQGCDKLVRGLLSERVLEQPKSIPSWRQYADVLERCGDNEAARVARANADTLILS